MAQHIKEVNGIKVVKRYSAGNIFSGILCLIFPLLTIFFLVLPWMNFKGTLGGGAEVDVQVKMLDVIKTIFNQENDYIGKVVNPLISEVGGSMPWLSPVLVATNIIAFILWVCLAIFAICELFFALEFLFRGKVTHNAAPFVLSIFASIATLFLGLVAMGIMFLFQLGISLPADESLQVEMYWLAIYCGASVLVTILLGVIYNIAFKNKVFIGDLGDLSHFKDVNQEEQENQSAYTTKEIVKIKYEPSVGLPPKLSSIGGHAFAQNMNLVVAMIPNGIKTLGQGAFANCGKLKIVSIPLSVKTIGFNCFFNCANLERINYAGTKEQWRHVKRGSNWLTKAGTYTVVCADGAIIVNPYH